MQIRCQVYVDKFGGVFIKLSVVLPKVVSRVYRLVPMVIVKGNAVHFNVESVFSSLDYIKGYSSGK